MRLAKGEVTFGTLFVIMMLAGYIFVGVKVGPVVWENFTVRKVLNYIGEIEQTTYLTTPQVRQLIIKNFQINNVRQVPTDALEIVTIDGDRYIHLEYEKRIHLFGQLDMVIKFSDHAEIID